MTGDPSKGSRSAAIRSAIAGMFAMAAAMGVGRFVYTPFLPLMISDGALNASSAGFVAGANFLGYLVGAFAASLVFFSKHSKFWMLAGLFGGVILSAAMALEFGFAWMAVIRFLSGVASAFAMIFVTVSVMAIITANGLSSLSAVHFAGVGAGIAISACLVSLLNYLGMDWQLIWIAAALLGLGAVLIAIFLLPHDSTISGTSGNMDRVSSPISSVLWIFIASYGFFGFGYVILATFINAMAKAEPALQAIEPWVWIIVGLSGIPSIWFWNRITVHLGSISTYVLACFTEAVGVGLPAIIVSPFALVIAAILLGGTFIAITAIGLSHARQLAPDNTSRAIALMTASFGLGQMIGPVVAGMLFERTGGLTVASKLAAIALVIAAGLALITQKLNKTA
ncbi:MAG: YbfB/YjiJ family MFS transporter [Rhizobiaceae bacterium]